MESLVSFAVALLLAPLFPGIIAKTKAFFAGKKGPPLLIKYWTLIKLLRKGSVYSTSTTPVFRIMPAVTCAAAIIPLLFLPLGTEKPLVHFHGDVILLFYILGMGRFFTIAAALDTGSPFEGMGAAREALFGTLAEVTTFLVLILLYRLYGSFSFADYFSAGQGANLFVSGGALLVLIIVALFMVLLTENSRVPVDDPNTHLELTMIHEVMVLDHSGPDLALIEWGAFCKLLFYSCWIGLFIYPINPSLGLLNLPLFYLVVGGIYLVIGVTESSMARFKMNLVPKFILTSCTLMFFTVLLTMGTLP